MKVVVSITGASGVLYAVSLLRNLDAYKYLIISENGKKVIERESDLKLEEIEEAADETFENDDLSCSLASGSSAYDAMVVIPCSLSTLSKIANGIADNLVCRVAQICLKERRKLVLVPRETPLNYIQIENMRNLCLSGAILLPAMPAFYQRPRTMEDIADFICGKVLEQLGIEHNLYKKWG